jgi:hypothetical protein
MAAKALRFNSTKRRGLSPRPFGNPEIMLNVFVHDIELAVTQFQAGKDKTHEPKCVKKFPPLLLFFFDKI